MSRYILLTIFVSSFLVACSTPHPSFDETATYRLSAAANIVDAVNNKNAEQYARDLHPDVVVRMYDGEVRLRGREAVVENRRQHFIRNPNARNELVHLVEIDDRVVMHDRVWLDAMAANEPANIVELFTFQGDKIVQIDVIQPANLFSPR